MLIHLQTVLMFFYKPLSLIGVCETWLKQGEEQEICIPNYKFVGNCPPNKRGDGVGLYVSNSLKFITRLDLDIFSEDIESVFIEVRNKVENIIVAVVYRPPSHNLSNFLSQLQESLIKIVQEKKNV